MQDKKNKILNLITIIFSIYLVELAYFLSPLFKKIYYGNITMLLVNALKIVVLIPLLAFILIKRNKTKEKKEVQSFKDMAITYISTLVVITAVIIVLKFKIKLELELGTNIVGVEVLNNLSTIVVNIMKLPLIICAIEEIEDLKGDKMKLLPLGGIASLILFGIPILFFTHIGLLGFVNLSLFFIYGLIYLVSNKSFKATLISSVLIYLL